MKNIQNLSYIRKYKAFNQPYFPFHGIIGTVEILLAGAPSMIFRLMAT
jgi:hypothetical protein